MTERADGMARQLIRDAVREMLLLYGTFPGAAERQATEREWELRIYKEAVKPLESDLAEARREKEKALGELGAQMGRMSRALYDLSPDRNPAMVGDAIDAAILWIKDLVAERDAALRENGVLRERLRALDRWCDERRNATDMTTLGMIQGQIRAILAPAPQPTVSVRLSGEGSDAAREGARNLATWGKPGDSSTPEAQEKGES